MNLCLLLNFFILETESKMWCILSEVKLSDVNSIKVVKDYDEKSLATFLLVKDIKNVDVVIPFDVAIWI